MEQDRIQQALARIEAAASRIERAATPPPAPPATNPDADLVRRHEALKREAKHADDQRRPDVQDAEVIPYAEGVA